MLFALIICRYLQSQNSSPWPIFGQMILIPGETKAPNYKLTFFQTFKYHQDVWKFFNLSLELFKACNFVTFLQWFEFTTQKYYFKWNISKPQNTYCRVKSKENRSRKNRFSALLSIQTHINSQNELVLSNSLKPVVCSSIRSSVWQNHLWARRALALRRKYICQFTYISRCSLLKEPFYLFLVSLPWYSLVA